ncbi:MAG: hypothetical protein AAGC65_16175 [Mucilaginibacter sp.]|uniref:hypothetical protein n=1 Tax=Mucilaginibacter sp. TaxID=1882438 RepID=UPI0031B49B63
MAGQVVEITDRITYYHTLVTLQQADGLFIPGSDAPRYTASKIYSYLLTSKPVLVIFNRESPAISVLRKYGVQQVYDYDTVTQENIYSFLLSLANGLPESAQYNTLAVSKYSAWQMTRNQCDLFDSITAEKNQIELVRTNLTTR